MPTIERTTGLTTTRTVTPTTGPEPQLRRGADGAAAARRRGGASGGIQYVAFPGSKVGWPLTDQKIQEEGAKLFAAWGGAAQLAVTSR